MQEPLSIAALKSAATEFAEELSGTAIPALFGVDNGKTIGTHVEVAFNEFITRRFSHKPGNAAKGIDFPALNVDLKVTSIKQPQSSCPFRDATQKVYGLGYHLLLLVYEKTDDHAARSARLNIVHVVFVNQEHTADYQMTRNILRMLSDGGDADDIDAYLEDRNIPLDAESRRQLAERVTEEPPALGFITISNALQWRLQYGHAIRACTDPSLPMVEDLRRGA